MKPEDLYRAIGNALPEYLEHSERESSHRCSMTLRICIAAALVLVLSLTAVAVPYIRNYISSVAVRQTHAVTVILDKSGESVLGAHADISLDTKLRSNAPATLESFYIPMYLAEHWQPCTQYRNREDYGHEVSGLSLRWEKGDGLYLVFTQLAQPGYTGDYPISGIDLGYADTYSVETRNFGWHKVQAVVVPPSQLEDLVDEGRQKFFWSDGDYIFSMEVNYDMSDALLEEIFQSISKVETVEDYMRIEYISPTASEPMAVDSPMMPAYIPDGWIQSIGGRQPDGSYLYLWNLQDELSVMSALEYVQTADTEFLELKQRDWFSSVEEYETETETINGCTFTIYIGNSDTQLLWRSEGYSFCLTSSGPNRLCADELVAIAKSVHTVS